MSQKAFNSVLQSHKVLSKSDQKQKKIINRTFFVNKLLTLFFNFLKNLLLNFAQKEDYWQNLENFFFSEEVIFGGQNPKKFLKFLLFQKVHPSPEIQQFL